MNILTYIAIAIGGIVAVGSTLSITLGILELSSTKSYAQLNIRYLYLTN